VTDADRLVERMTSAYANVRAFLWLIRSCEGTAAPNGYRYLFGSTYAHEKLFSDTSKHPNLRVPFSQKDGRTNYTTAAGAYQFIYPTWRRVAMSVSLPDFGEESQDRGAVELIRERGMLDEVEAGHVGTAMDVLWIEWASLPASQYSQPRRTYAFACDAFCEAGGTIT